MDELTKLKDFFNGFGSDTQKKFEERINNYTKEIGEYMKSVNGVYESIIQFQQLRRILNEINISFSRWTIKFNNFRAQLNSSLYAYSGVLYELHGIDINLLNHQNITHINYTLYKDANYLEETRYIILIKRKIKRIVNRISVLNQQIRHLLIHLYELVSSMENNLLEYPYRYNKFVSFDEFHLYFTTKLNELNKIVQDLKLISQIKTEPKTEPDPV